MSSHLTFEHLQSVQILPALSRVDDDGQPQDFRQSWLGHASGPTSVPGFFCAQDLRRLYPNHTLAISDDSTLDILTFPDASFTPIDDASLVENLHFTSAPRSSAKAGSLKEEILFGSYKGQWQDHCFILHTLSYSDASTRGCSKQIRFLLHEGQTDILRAFLTTVGTWSNELHNEILVFHMGMWSKNKELWSEVQKANWDDVILETGFKKKLQQDVSGFFDSKDLYKELSIPWKRGLIMHGPPGNGKTISVKAILKTCSTQGLPLLYVKSFKTYQGDEYTIATVFQKARHMAPCVIVLEDLDSLVNDGNRSFFLNQLDGLEGNDGLLLIATTNHFDRLDAGISSRPSRFDRKFLFNDPDLQERKLYAQYWQQKLSNHQSIDFPETLVDEFAGWAEKFSFAYLKEALVSSLVLMAGMARVQEQTPFCEVLKSQVEVLKEELHKPKLDTPALNIAVGTVPQVMARPMRAF